MDILSLAIATGLSFCFLAALFRPLELAFPARPGQPFFRPDWFTDLCFFFGQYLLWSGLVLWGISGVAGVIDGIVPAGFRASVASQPFWLQAIEVILLSDVMIYWGHRLQHRVEFLWRFHSVHHSAEHLDWLAAHREHPLDSIYTIGLINLPAIMLGFSLEALVGLIAFRGLLAIYIHSNVRLPIGPLRYLIGSPQIHHWHHDRDRDAGNYANLSPLMDIVFGTYYCPDQEPESYGLREPLRGNYLTHLLRPLLPKGLRLKLSKRWIRTVGPMLFCLAFALAPESAEAQYSWNRPQFHVDLGTFLHADTISTIPINEYRAGVVGARVVLLDSLGRTVATASYVAGSESYGQSLYGFDSLPHQKVTLRVTHDDYMTLQVPIDGERSLPGGWMNVLHPAVGPIPASDGTGPPILRVNLGQEGDLWTGSYAYGYRPYPRLEHVLVFDYPEERVASGSGGEEIGMEDTLRRYVASLGNVEVLWNDCGKMLIGSARRSDSTGRHLWDRAGVIAGDLKGLGVVVGFFGGMTSREDRARHRRNTYIAMLGPHLDLGPALSPVRAVDSLLAAALLPDTSSVGTQLHRESGILTCELPNALGPRIFDVVDTILRSGLVFSFGYNPGRICIFPG